MRKNLRNFILILGIILLSKYIQIIGLIIGFSKLEYFFFNIRQKELKLKLKNEVKEVRFHIKTSKPKVICVYSSENKLIDSFFISKEYLEKWFFFGFKVENNEIVLKIKKEEGDTSPIILKGALFKLKNEEEMYVRADGIRQFVDFDKKLELKFKRVIPDLKGILYALSTSWDAYWYKSIILQGYSYDKNFYKAQNPQFAPLYPLLCKATNYLLKNIELSMIFVSNLLGLIAYFVIFFIIYNLSGEKSAFRTLILYLLYPGALFFTVPYSESTAVLISSISFHFLIKRNYSLSFLLIGIGTAARFHLIFFSVSFLIIYIMEERKKLNFFKLFLYTILSFSGIILYSLYLWIKFKEPFAHYLLWKYAWGNGNWISNLFKNIIFLLKIMDFIVIPQQTYLIVFWLFCFSIVQYSKKYSIKDKLFIASLVPFCGILISTLSQGHPKVYLASLTRFFYSIFPLFLVLEKTLNDNLFWLFSIVFIVMLFCNSLFFNPLSIFKYIP
ncbi:MAG: hypothetical protein ABDH49_07390 [Candidatus Hydrothermales bacterium]